MRFSFVGEFDYEGLFSETEIGEKNHSIEIEYQYCMGKRHGFFREFDGRKAFKKVGHFEDNVQVGGSWTKLAGNAFFFRFQDPNNNEVRQEL